MDKVSLYLRESYNELVHNVSWPSYSTLQTNTILVLAGSAIFALLIFGMDVVWQFVVNNVYDITGLSKQIMAVTKWYSLRVISGKEKKIKERIEKEISRNNWEDHVMKIVVPTEKVYKIRGGKKVISDRNILPGYILVEADPYALNGKVLDGITSLPNVIGLPG